MLLERLNYPIKVLKTLRVKKSRLALLGLLLSSNFAAAEADREVMLVRDGKPAATIVVAAEPTRVARLAAMELQYHLRKITGADLPISADDVEIKGNRILVGESAATLALGLRSADFAPQEYAIKFLPSAIVLIGRDKDDRGALDYVSGHGFPSIFDEQGTMYATYDFLERYCDIRWYLPTQIGITYKPRKTLSVGGEDIRRSPYMEYRFVSPGYAYPLDLCGDTVRCPNPDNPSPAMLPLPRRDHMLWLFRNRMGGKAFAVNHSFEGYYDRFAEKHPEWFAQGREGSRRQMCFTNPEFIKQVVQDARNFFDGKGKEAGAQAAGDYFALVPMDNNQWCKCPDCQALLLEEATLGKGMFSNNRSSNYIFHFVNQVARQIRKSHPDKWISTIAYWDYAYPPDAEPLEPNVNVTLCLHVRGWMNPGLRDNDLAILRAWSKTDNPIYLWMYYCWPSLNGVQSQTRIFPVFFGHEIVKQNRIFRKYGVRGMKYEPSYLAAHSVWIARQSALLDQVEFYITWRLADNPNLDGDKLIDEFFIRYYGAAAEPMKAFYERMEQIAWDRANYPAGVSGMELYWGHLGTEERMAELGNYMEQAKKATVTETEKARLALFEKGIWQYMKKGYERYWKHGRIPLSSVTVPRVNVTAAPENPLNLDWSKAGRLTGWRVINGEETDKWVEGRLLHDGAYLYIRLEDRMDTKKLVDRDGSVWNSDLYELFFAGQRAAPYNHIGVTFIKGRYTALRHGGGIMKPWDSGVKILSDITPDRWMLYLVFPLEKLLPDGVKPGKMFYFNVIRSMRANDAIAWNPTLGGYHAPGRFGQVILK